MLAICCLCSFCKSDVFLVSQNSRYSLTSVTVTPICKFSCTNRVGALFCLNRLTRCLGLRRAIALTILYGRLEAVDLTSDHNVEDLRKSNKREDQILGASVSTSHDGPVRWS